MQITNKKVFKTKLMIKKNRQACKLGKKGHMEIEKRQADRKKI